MTFSYMLHTSSSNRFLEMVRSIADAPFCMASIDYDHLGFFLNCHGSGAICPALEGSRKLIAASLETGSTGGSWIWLDGSLDEILIAQIGISPDAMADRLRQAARRVEQIWGRSFGPSGPIFGFTAAIAYSEEFAEAESIDERIWAMESACVTAIATAKESHHASRRVAVAVRNRPVTINVRTPWALWRNLAVECHTPIPVAGPTLARAGQILVVNPLFGGEFFERTIEEFDGGFVSLPDGERFGKLGFLNRLFGPGHLTANLVIESVFDTIVKAPPILRFSERVGEPARICSSLLVPMPAETGCRNDLGELLIDWFETPRRRIGAVLGPGLEVSVFRAAILDGCEAALNRIIEMGRHLYRIEPMRYARSGPVALFDYRGAAPGTFGGAAEVFRNRSISKYESKRWG